MNLPISTIAVDSGLVWETNVNASLSILDGHDHSTGKGVPISPNGMNINSDLSFNSNNGTDFRSVRFTPQPAVITQAADVGCVYVVGNELYYNDVTGGHQIQITLNGNVNAGAGSISGLPSGTASASFSAGVFIWQSATATAANMDAGSYVFRNATANSKGLTLSPPNAMAADYSITLPSLPASTLPLSIDTGGNIGAAPITAAQLAAAVAQALNPSGSIIAFGGSAAPSGYLLCDGSAVSRTTYSVLFSAIGTAYGIGNGTTTFNIPDCRGMFIRGVTGTSTNDPDALTRTSVNGGNAGNMVGSVQPDDFRSHIHNQGAGSGGSLGIPQAPNGITPFTNTTPTGGNETRPINIYFNYCIKT